MRNRITKILVIILLLFVLVACSRSEYTYNQNGATYTISDYTGSSAYLQVPNEFQGKIIDVIDYNTYAYNINIIHVKLSDNTKLIKECAFWFCTNIETIYIPKGLEKIEECAFYRCDNLKYVYFEEAEANVNLEILGFNDCFKNATA
ncbi:MAG: leucine-rich repeat protein, partial [Bacilli bacterium]|nr:leucine-rich repeat protein [Bacilli bacterium]